MLDVKKTYIYGLNQKKIWHPFETNLKSLSCIHSTFGDTKEPPYYAALEGFMFGLSFLRTQEPRGAPF